MTHVLLRRADDLLRQGALREAEALLRVVLQRSPDEPLALRQLALVLHQRRDDAAAVACMRRAMHGNGAFAAEDHFNYGVMLEGAGQQEQAIAQYRLALQRRPGFADALLNLGNCLLGKGRLDEAAVVLQEAVSVQPGFPEALNSLGLVFQEKNCPSQAMDLYRRALTARPDYAEAAANLSWLLLLNGQFKEGWQAMEARIGERDIHMHREIVGRRWDGSDPAGLRILLHAEQGYGDSIQFIRYARLVHDRGAHVIFYGPPPLVRLFQNQCGIDEICSETQPIPAFDAHCPLMSLPRIFDTTLETIPADIPYLTADPNLVVRWKQRIASFVGESAGKMLNVGLAWSGNPRQKRNVVRSASLNDLQPLGQICGVQFFSLQIGAAARQVSEWSGRLSLIDWTDELKDFADTAALIAALDLVITVDTSVAHLAGASGKDVWVILALAADWRYLLDREDSPWYPTMRLFRQQRSGDWSFPVQELACSLAQMGSESTPGNVP